MSTKRYEFKGLREDDLKSIQMIVDDFNKELKGIQEDYVKLLIESSCVYEVLLHDLFRLLIKHEVIAKPEGGIDEMFEKAREFVALKKDELYNRFLVNNRFLDVLEGGGFDVSGKE
ncbi:MAG: hypothetical protein PHG20_08840 [Geobacteraceae bacterium]|nr:hypothetical protein [Geobacteraceae bacterium]